MSNYFFDAHMHAMNLNHPDFVSLVESISDGFSEFVISGALSSGYLLTPANRGQHGLTTILNLFSLFERSLAEIFCLIEDDLLGLYSPVEDEGKGKSFPNRSYPAESYLRDGKFHFRQKTYDKFALIPLVMDFSSLSQEWGRNYYSRNAQEKIFGYVEDTLQGIREYKRQRPDGMLEFFPFLGINTHVHSKEFIEQLLTRYIKPKRTFSTGKISYRSDRAFWGVKFYPPLGSNPWPEEDPQEMEKVELVYDFCCSNNVPLTTHCDDQGFRGVTAKLAQHYSDPLTWRKVLEHYPTLRLDFAHYGKQYSPLALPPLKALLEDPYTGTPWFKEIINCMRDFPNVYADFSFTGTDVRFYEHFHQFLESLEDRPLAEKVKRHSLFGSDFSVNLSKVESYTNYLHIFETSPFSDAEIEAFSVTNPLAFLEG